MHPATLTKGGERGRRTEITKVAFIERERERERESRVLCGATVGPKGVACRKVLRTSYPLSCGEAGWLFFALPFRLMWEYYVIMRSSAGGLDTRALGRQSAKHANRGVQNLAIREQRSVVVSEPFACCMSKANRIAKAVVAVAIVRLEGRRIGIGRGSPRSSE